MVNIERRRRGRRHTEVDARCAASMPRHRTDGLRLRRGRAGQNLVTEWLTAPAWPPAHRSEEEACAGVAAGTQK